MTLSASHRSLDPAADWAFFDSDFPATPRAREATCALASDSAEAFWQEHLSANPVERHPMLLPTGHWLRATVDGPNWVTEFNHSSTDRRADSAAVARFLRDQFDLPENELVYFVAMRETCYCAPWWVVLSCWQCFLAMDDEGSFFFHPTSGKFASFGPNGSLGFGFKASAPLGAA